MIQQRNAKEEVIEIQNTLGAIPLEDEKFINGIIIQAFRPNFLKRIIMEKPSVEATRHIRPLYIRAHLNGKPFSRVLNDNGLAVNIMPSRLLYSLGKTEEELIVINIAVAKAEHRLVSVGLVKKPLKLTKEEL